MELSSFLITQIALINRMLPRRGFFFALLGPSLCFASIARVVQPNPSHVFLLRRGYSSCREELFDRFGIGCHKGNFVRYGWGAGELHRLCGSLLAALGGVV